MDKYSIKFEVQVEDEGKLIQYAQDRYHACWNQDLEEIVSGGESLVERALLEAILFSNENPSPSEWGVGFTGVTEITPV